MKFFSYLFLTCIISFSGIKAQVLYKESFSTYTLSSYNDGSLQFNYNTLPSVFDQIKDGFPNDTSIYNKPFNQTTLLKREGWALFNYSAAYNDTFAVATSWLDTTNIVAANRWFITPVIHNISSNSLLTWEAMCPDANNRDGYEVYITTNTSNTLTTTNFSTSNLLFSLKDNNNGGNGEETSWTKRGVNLSAYAGQNVRIAFRSNSRDKFQLWIDDITVENTSTTTDVSLMDMINTKYTLINTTNYITATLKNTGFYSISSVGLTYKLGTNTPVSQTFSMPNALLPFAVTQVTFAIPYAVTSATYNPLTVYVSHVNGGSDATLSDDTIHSFVSSMTSAGTRKILLKELTSAAEGWCPDGQVMTDTILYKDTSVIAMAIHVNDSMLTGAGNLIAADFPVQNYPSATVNNRYWSDVFATAIQRESWSGKIVLEKTMASPLSIEVLNPSYNSSTRAIDFDVKMTFSTVLMGDYRLNVDLIENNICGAFGDGTNNHWNQFSYLYSVPTSPYYHIGQPYTSDAYILDAWNYKHQRVMIQALDGAYGDNTAIPSSGTTVGQSITKHYSYILPNAYDNAFIYHADNIHVIAYVEEFNSNIKKRLILNTCQAKLTSNPEMEAVSVQELHGDISVQVYPNPAKEMLYVHFPASPKEKPVFEILNSLGQTMSHIQPEALNDGYYQFHISSLPNGLYFLNIKTAQHSITSKIIVNN